jgi:hypothetical protein
MRPCHCDAAGTNGLDLLGPRIDERDVVTGAREERAEVAADSSRTDEEDLLAHGA